jgi:methylenetetrahydrofolate/methylenetetrahydromethanopterin dehydrogenase (NADP+)
VKKLLIQLDSSQHPSVFDQVVAHDGGADEVMSYGGVTEDAVRDLVHGAIFTRGPKDLHNTAIFIGGTDMSVGERLLSKVKKAFFGPMRVSVMLDSNGSNTTAVAAVSRIQQAAGSVDGKRILVTAGSGPVGIRAAGLLAKAGAHVTVTTRRKADGSLSARIQERFGVTVGEVTMADASGAAAALEDAEVFLSAGPAGVCLVPKDAWMGRAGLRVAVDVNAVPPLGVEGIEVTDNAVDRGGVTTFGALGVGNLKMKIHKACIAKLFEKNDQVLDAETIADVARELTPARSS